MSSADIAIKVQNLSKCYHIYVNPRDRLKQYFREFWALKVASLTGAVTIEKEWQWRGACD
jgi:hypothetical protein